MRLPNKLPAENLAYTIDLTNWLAIGDTITAATSTLQVGDVLPGDVTFTDTAVTFWLSGGTLGTDCKVLITATTVGGLTYADLAEITIGEPVPSSTTKRALIETAFSEVALNGWEYDIEPEEKDRALTRLDALMRELEAMGINALYNFPAGIGQGDLDDDLGCPDGMFSALSILLAQRLCPTMGKTLSGESRVALYEARRTLRALAPMVPPSTTLASSVPIGAGNKPWSTRFPFSLR